jgi:phage shock protein PspC (stress-responsive transcriptional regulator)
MKKLYRSRIGSIAGICTGLGEFAEIDETIIKLLFLCLIFTPFPIITIYLLAWIVIPKSYE